MESPYLGQEVILKGLVIADIGGVEPGGYLLLDETCPLNGEASRGIYVFLGDGSDLVDLGDEIRVSGTVREIEGETRLEANLQGLEFLSLENPQPDPVDLEKYLFPPLTFGYEIWEGQLVAIPRVDLVNVGGDPDRIRVVPHLPLNPLNQLICFQEESFLLEIRKEGLNPSEVQSDGYIMEGLIGVIRQDNNGYYLQLIKMPNMRLIDQDPQVDEDFQLNPIKSMDNPSPLPITQTSTLTMTPEPSFTVTLTPSPTIIPSPTYYPIRLLISEVLPNPSGEEPGGEWIEIYNPAGERLPLDGLKIGDEISPVGKEGLLRFPDGYFINEGQVIVIANQARIFRSQYGFLPDFELVDSESRVPDLVPYSPWGRSAVKLSNSGDEVLLVDPWDHVVDLVVYGKTGSSGFSPPVAAPMEGHSLERYPPEVDNDQALDWRERSSPSPGWLDRSSPTPDVTPTSSPWPSPTWSTSPETTTSTPTLMMTQISPMPSITSTGTFLTTNTVSPTMTPSITNPSTITMTPVPFPSDTPEMTSSLSPPSPTPNVLPTASSIPGSITITPSATMTFTVVPFGTPSPSLAPTTATPTIIPGPVIVINEIHADPDPVQGDSNGDGEISSDDDEFLELVNISGQILDLSGWQVYDEVRLRFIFPDGAFLAPGCGLVLFGGGEPSGDFGGSLVFTAGSLGLNNTGDIVTLLDPAGGEMVAIEYGSEGNQNQSLTRYPDLLGPLPLVLHSQLPAAGETLYSPGIRIDGMVFGSCP